MLEYLIDYGIKKHTFVYEELDITDKLNLQKQINETRKNHYQLINLLDDVQTQLLEVDRAISVRTKELLSTGVTSRNIALSNDDEFLSLEAKQAALKTACTMINSQLDFCKSDLRILQSCLYNKF